MRLALCVLGVTAVLANGRCLAGEAARTVHVNLPEELGEVAHSAAAILARQIGARCDAEVVTTGPTDCVVTLGVDPALPEGGFRIEDGPDESVRVLGGDEPGVLYGVGKLLRESRYDQGGFTVAGWRGESAPRLPLRGIYLANHFNNYYEAAPPEDIERYIEDLALWGSNVLDLGFPHWQYDSYDDPAARRMIEHMRALMRAAKRVGMKVCVGAALNGGFKGAPEELLCTPVPDPLGRHGNFGVNLCPAKPEARELLLRQWDRLLDEFNDPGLDFVIYWPYDEGGCGCEECWPWGGRGYLSLARDVTARVRASRPGVRVILSTWTFDTPPAGEWEALSQALAEHPGFADVIQADAHEDYPRYPLDQGVPGGLPLISFPEISMWGQGPWGGYGANPLPERLQRLWDQTEGKLAGGTPYSEGVYEDINKAICAQLFWDPDRATLETVREYAAFEFSPDVADEVVEVVRTFERNHLRDHIGPDAAEALERVRAIEARLTPQARSSWRWRIVALRALIDAEVLRTGGRLEGSVLRDAFNELTAIYHAEGAHSMPIHPPVIEGEAE